LLPSILSEQNQYEQLSEEAEKENEEKKDTSPMGWNTAMMAILNKNDL
jgi:hypothetical protein